MYYPYFRGKRFELLLLRERASLFGDNTIHPIIEPVRNAISSLRNTARELVNHKTQFVLVINPQCGELKTNPRPIFELVQAELNEYSGLSLGYVVTAETDDDKLKRELKNYSSFNISIIHYGYADGKGLAAMLSGLSNIKEHIFIDGYAGNLYRKNFENCDKPRILIRDGFKIRRNDAYPATEHFSDLHLTYPSEGMQGFGDFLIIGEEYRDKGFAAYAVVIHLTYLNKDNDMHIKHFISDRTGSTADPAGKFGEACSKLVSEINSRDSEIYVSDACNEYMGMPYRGLGFLKKLSMQHHLELIAEHVLKRKKNTGGK
jgi:hypothetical protein